MFVNTTVEKEIGSFRTSKYYNNRETFVRSTTEDIDKTLVRWAKMKIEEKYCYKRKLALSMYDKTFVF